MVKTKTSESDGRRSSAACVSILRGEIGGVQTENHVPDHLSRK
ncbi:MAG TPA: hypothetical protein VL921_15330 [Candidatus Udaeobacter sp.]|nr:hypothetical protein [Candidatus Udaeobacter sp.]